ncbi:tetratricopeptide repeat protein [Streptomyces tibetensis]|uniref:tetratricopeptide repeat protein n=1 Tax=Streptomyces tibetensis TaxID=2382123 RepID=UPI00380156EB
MRRPVRSAYLRQVERIAPPQLLGREAELAELAGFCLDERRGPYVWWRAGPWAGKSALLSTFVLNPPAPPAADGVWLVSFFITARLAGQDTREAFTIALTEQLCALLGQDLPVSGDEAAREAAMMDLLAQAAAVSQQAGGRLVLVVDGLDEDRGVTTGRGAHSIAGLLPGRPPAGMRIIVAGRPNPPIPDDVPDWHPLRDPGIIRLLSDSPQARDLQRLGQSELKRLLAGSPIEQDLLGLLTAARGGLSGPDLRELTGADLVTIEEILHTVAGRTFTRRLAGWTPDDGRQVYLLGHEELHNAACHYLGHDRLAHYRERLHTWAEEYRTPTDGRPPWPPHTPEYLLTGYPRMLATAGDTNRLTTLAIDPARHDRMLDLSGGDTAALTEIKTCQDLLLDCPEPDLYALAMLSHHRGQLESRNAHVPTKLPALWATLGQPNRAEQIARGLTDPREQARALIGVAKAVAEAGDHDRAAGLAADVEQIARSITEPDDQAKALAMVAGAVTEAGDHEWAAGLAADAEQVARTTLVPWRQGLALAEVAEVVAEAGDHERAARLAADVEQFARTLTDSDQAWVLAGVARAVAAAGDHERAEQIARTYTESHEDWVLAGVARAVAAAGDHERAEQIARSITSAWQQVRALIAVAEAGDHERAAGFVADAEQIARAITVRDDIPRMGDEPDDLETTMAEVAGAVAAVGDHDRAEQIARTITHPQEQARALIAVAGAVAEAGDHERAAGLAAHAEQNARTITNPLEQAWALVAVAGAVAEAGDHERAAGLAAHAEQIARTITDPDQQAWALVDVAGAVAAAGDHERAEQIARTLTDAGEQAKALAGVARAVAEAGDHERAAGLAAHAEQVAHTLGPFLSARALAEVAGAVAAVGDHERAEQIARTLTDAGEQAQALTGVAETVAGAGDHEWAERIALTITQPDYQARALAGVAKVVAAAGDHERAARLAADAEEIARAFSSPYQRSWTLIDVAGAVAAAGGHERAEQIARTLTDPDHRAWALIGVAEVVGLPQAGHLLGTAFALGSWRRPLSAWAKLCPQEVIRIADAVYANDGFARLSEEPTHVTGTDHPNTLQARARLAYKTGTAGDPAGAAAIQEELLVACMRVLGPDHPDTLTTMGILAHWRDEAGDHAGAAAAWKRLLTARVRVLGPDHPDSITSWDQLASSRAKAGDSEGAAAATAELAAGVMRLLGPDHPHARAAQGHLAYYQGMAGDANAAAIAFAQLLEDCLRALGPDHPDTRAIQECAAYWQARANEEAP